MVRCPKIDSFCYVCGKYMVKHGHESKHSEKRQSQTNVESPEFIQRYTHYFNQTIMIREEFTPNFVCHTCYNRLRLWWFGSLDRLPYITPMIWINDPLGHIVGRCYACKNEQEGTTRRKTKVYESTFTGQRPIPFPKKGILPPKPPAVSTSTAPSGSSRDDFSDVGDPTYQPSTSSGGLELLTQKEMDYAVARLNLSQRNAEFLAVLLKAKRFTGPEVKSTGYRRRQREYQQFYTLDASKKTAYCHDVSGLIKQMKLDDNAKDWRLFVDGSASSLKAVLLHKSNKKPSIPLFLRE